MNQPITRCLGLVTQQNSLNLTPGALSVAKNCVIDRENIVEDRRGYAVYGALSNAAAQLFVYSSKVLCHNGTAISEDNGSGTFSAASGSYNAPSGQKMRALEAFQNCYLTTDAGVQVLTDVAGTAARKAGAPRALDPSYALNAAGSGFLATGSQCAYRSIIQRIDANKNTLNGYPSQRLWVVNASGASKNIDITEYLPSEAIAGDIIQFYRTAQVTGTSSDTSGDECALVYQAAVSATDITNGYITFTDASTDALRGASLYTSPSQEGIAQANDRPPLCKDLALYLSNYLMYANTSTKQRLFFTLVGVSGLTGKTITLGGVTYNFGATEISSGAGSPQAQVGATGVVATDIDTTARSLVRVINRYASNTTVYAYYLSGPTDLPGLIMIEERGVGGAAFTLQSSDTTIAGMFFPAPPVSPSTNTQSTSTNQVQKNALFYSKYQQLEAVPAFNYLLVGSANKNILRIAALKSSLIVIKEEGVYILTGTDPSNFIVTPLDLTVKCKAVDSVAVLNNRVYMLSNQGVVAISETGAEIISHDIEPDIRKLLSYSTLPSYTTGFAYESDRKYFLSTMSASSDTAQTITYVYNYITNAWTTWTFGVNAGVVEDGADKIYFTKSGTSTVYRERKDFADSDFADPESSITVTAIDTTLNTVTFTISGATPDVGWAISQGGTSIPIKKLVNNSGAGTYTATMLSSIPTLWVTGAATIYPGVGYEVAYHPFYGGNAKLLKQVREVAILSDSVSGLNTASEILMTFYSNFDPAQVENVKDIPGGGWGASWGAIPWGGSGDSYGYRMWVPNSMQLCTRLTLGVKHKNALERLCLAGADFDFEVVSEVGGT